MSGICNAKLPPWLRSILGTISALLVLLLPAPAYCLSDNDSPGRASYPFDVNEGPGVGDIGGIKVSIPHRYLLSGVQYVGEDPWSGKPNQFTPSYQSPIDNFAIRIRLPTFHSIESEQDWKDYEEFGKTAYPASNNRWTWLQFQRLEGHITGNNFKQKYVAYLKDETHWGPFVLQDADFYGLKHGVSKTHRPENDISRPDEIFYDSKTWATFIVCANYHRTIPPYDPMSHCTHQFLIPALNAFGEVGYEKGDLFRWRDLEMAGKQFAEAFIQKD